MALLKAPFFLTGKRLTTSTEKSIRLLIMNISGYFNLNDASNPTKNITGLFFLRFRKFDKHRFLPQICKFLKEQSRFKNAFVIKKLEHNKISRRFYIIK